MASPYPILRLTEFSFEFLVVPPFLFITLGLSVLLWFAARRVSKKGLWRQNLWLLSLQFLVFPALILIGYEAAVPSSTFASQPAKWAVVAGDVAIAFGAIYGLACVYRMKDVRPFAFCVLLVQCWMTQGAALVTSCAITGLWL